MKKIEEIDLKTILYGAYAIFKDDIETFQIKLHEIELEDSGIKQEVIEEMILVIKDIDGICPINNIEDFDIDSTDISAIRIFYDDDTEVEYMVSMTHDEYNRGQMNRLYGYKLYISIRDESNNVLED